METKPVPLFREPASRADVFEYCVCNPLVDSGTPELGQPPSSEGQHTVLLQVLAKDPSCHLYQPFG